MIKIDKKINKLTLLVMILLPVLYVTQSLQNNIIKAEAQEEEILLTDDDYYTIGATLNATQDGRSQKSVYREIVDFGRDIVDTVMDNGIRFNRVFRKRAGELIINPVNLFEVFKIAWKDFTTFHITQVADGGETFVIDLGDTLHPVNRYDRGGTGAHKYKNFYFRDYPAYPFEIPTRDVALEFIGTNLRARFSVPGIKDLDYSGMPNYEYFTHVLDDYPSGGFIGRNPSRIFLYPEREVGDRGKYNLDKTYDGHSFIVSDFNASLVGFQLHNNSYYIPEDAELPIANLRKIIITKNYETIDYAAMVPYNEIPPVLTIEENYSSTFTEAYEEETAEPDEEVWYSYDVPTIVNETNPVIINNDYVTNNYVTVERHNPTTPPGDTVRPSEPEDPGLPVEPEEPEEPEDPEEPEEPDYPEEPDPESNNMLERILAAIKALPQQIKEQIEGILPEAEGEGGGFWDSLFEAITGLAGAFGEFITSIPQLILDLLDGLLGLVEKIVALFIPTTEQMQELADNFSQIADDFTARFSFVTDISSAFSSVFAAPKSLTELTITIADEEINIMPQSLVSALPTIRSVLSGFVVLFTGVNIYKRFTGSGDVIQ